MKKTLILILTLFMVLCFGTGLMACKEEEKIALIDFNNQTIDIGYGDEYSLELTVKDSKGNLHALTAEVKTEDGKEVAVTNGKFIVNTKNDYIITYKFVKGEQTETRVVTAKVVAKKAPVVQIDGKDGPFVKGGTISLPTATVYDYFDGELDYTVKAYKQADGGDQEIVIEDGEFTVGETGVYYAEYSAVNSYNVTGKSRITYTVKEAEDLASLVKVVDGVQGGVIYNGDVASTFIPAGTGEIEGFKGEYTGNAIGFNIATNPNYRFNCAYTSELVNALSKTYEEISMWIAVDGIASGNAYIMHADHIAGYKSFAWTALNETSLSLAPVQRQWIRLTMDTVEFANIAGVNDFVNLFYTWSDGMTYKEGFTAARIYVGDIEFHKPIPTVTVNSKGGLFVKGAELQLPTATAVDKTDGEISYITKVYKGEQEIPVVDGKFTPNEVGEYTVEYLAENSAGIVGKSTIYYNVKEASEFSDIVKVVDGVQGNVIFNKDLASRFVASDSDKIKDFAGDYKGNAIEFNIKINAGYSLKTEYSPELIRAMSSEYNYVTMYVAIDGIATGGVYMMSTGAENFNSFQWIASNKNMLSLAGKQRQWIKLAVEIDDFADYVAQGSQIRLFYIWTDGATPAEGFDAGKVYVSDITFEKSAPEITVNSNGGLFVKGAELIYPTAIATDNNEGELDYTVSVYKKVDGGEDELITETGDSFIPQTVGDYYLVYTAENSIGVKVTATVNYQVVDGADLKYIAKITDGVQGDKIFNKDLPATFVSADSDKIKNFAGDYKGNAVEFKVAINAGYSLKTNYSPELIRAMSGEYNRVSMWIAVDGIASGGVYMMSTGAADFSSFQWTAMSGNMLSLAGKQEQWLKLSMSTEDFANLVGSNESIRLFYIWSDGITLEEGFDSAKVYVGDVEFYYEAPTILTVDNANFGNIHMFDGASVTAYSFVDANSDEIKDFAGTYSGNATKLKTFTNNGYRFVNPYSLEQLNEIKQSGKVDNVSLYFAMSGLTAGSARFNVHELTYPDTFLNRAGIAGNKWFVAEATTGSHLAMNTWYKFSVTLDDYIALVTDTATNTAKQYCPLMSTWFYQQAGEMAYYVGNIFFEKTPVFPSVTNKDVTATNMTADEWSADGITGDYAGTAKKFHMLGANSGFKYANPYTEQELTEMKANYSTVTLKFAVSIKVGTFYLFDTGFEGLASPGTTGYNATKQNINTWLTWTVSLEDYIELVSANNYEYFAPWTNAYSEGITEGGITVYFGELVFA